MGRNRKQKSVSVRKSVQHVLPQINLSEDLSEPVSVPDSPTTQLSSDKQMATRVNVERRSDILDEDEDVHDHDDVHDQEGSDDYERVSSEDETVFSNRKRKTKETEEDNVQKRTRKLFVELLLFIIIVDFIIVIFLLGYVSTIKNMQNVQNQMFTIIQDIQTKVNEMYVDWKAGGSTSHIENNTKWIDVSDTIKFFYLVAYI
jgi:hypothetical protein